MLYDYPSFGTIILTPEVIEIFRVFRQDGLEDKEAGGYLFGELLGNQLVIKQASKPGTGDIRRRTFFKRNARRGQKILDWLWRVSKRSIILVGEWHSHPEPIPTPSAKDLSEIQASFQHNYFPLGFMVVIIVGNRTVVDSWVGIQSTVGIQQVFRAGHLLWSD